MKVAAPRWKHSWMLGQRADSQTVWRFRRRSPALSWFSDSKWVRLLRAHSGRRGRGARGGLPIWTRESLTLFPEGIREARIGEVGLGLAEGRGVVVRADHDAHQVLGAGAEEGREAFLLEGARDH